MYISEDLVQKLSYINKKRLDNKLTDEEKNRSKRATMIGGPIGLAVSRYRIKKDRKKNRNPDGKKKVFPNKLERKGLQ